MGRKTRSTQPQNGASSGDESEGPCQDSHENIMQDLSPGSKRIAEVAFHLGKSNSDAKRCKKEEINSELDLHHCEECEELKKDIKKLKRTVSSLEDCLHNLRDDFNEAVKDLKKSIKIMKKPNEPLVPHQENFDPRSTSQHAANIPMSFSQVPIPHMGPRNILPNPYPR